jgi:hypothetical protein
MAARGANEGPGPRRRLPWRVVAGLIVGAVLVALVLTRLPKQVDGTGTLDGCALDRGWPVVLLDAGSEPYLPVSTWPAGMTYDLAERVLVDASGRTVVSRGDRILVKGSIVEVHGDPSPCYFTRGIRIDTITPA